MKHVLHHQFQNIHTRDLLNQFSNHACVAIILKGTTPNDLEIGFIQRALNPDDRWSGHLAFPGGRREEFDRTALDAAIRETKEEVGVQLSPDELLGKLNDLQARKSGQHLDFFIRPFVFHIERELKTHLDPLEVADFFWVPLSEIKNPQRQTTYSWHHDNQEFKVPAVHLDKEIPLWGLTYIMVQDLFEVINS